MTPRLISKSPVLLILCYLSFKHPFPSAHYPVDASPVCGPGVPTGLSDEQAHVQPDFSSSSSGWTSAIASFTCLSPSCPMPPITTRSVFVESSSLCVVPYCFRMKVTPWGWVSSPLYSPCLLELLHVSHPGASGLVPLLWPKHASCAPTLCLCSCQSLS